MPLAWVTARLPLWQFAILLAVATAIAIWAAREADAFWHTHDSGRIVIDEVVGYLATVALIDRSSLVLLGLGFVLFRVADIAKPPPVRWIDRNVPGGAGVVLDDMAAGVLAGAALYGLTFTSLPAWLGSLF